MNSSLIYSAVTAFLLLPFAIRLRAKPHGVGIAAVVIFVMLLPWFRFIFAGVLNDRWEAVYFEMYFSMFLFCFGLFIVGLYASAVGHLRSKTLLRIGYSDNEPFFRNIIVIIGVAWALRFYRAYAYGIMTSGSGSEQAILKQAYWFVVAYSIAKILMAGSIVLLAARFRQHRIMAILVVGAEIAWSLFAEGRREFIFWSVLIIYIYFIFTQKNIFRIISFVLLFAVFLLQFVIPFFLVFRSAFFDLNSSDIFDSFQFAIQEAFRIVFEAGSESTRIAKENMEVRGDVGQFLGSVIESVNSGYGLMYGRALVVAASWSIPSIFFGKPEYEVEQYIQWQMGLPLADDAISWICLGYADFGVLGSGMYGVILGLLLVLIQRISMRGDLYLIPLSGNIAAFYVAYNVEADPLLAFASLRNIFIVVLFYRLFKIVYPGSKSKSDQLFASKIN